MGVSMGSQISADEVRAEDFARFVDANESRLRHSLCAVLGSQRGHDATAEALAYGWEHWDRVGIMSNPAGYLYKVGRDRGSRLFRRERVHFEVAGSSDMPEVEPRLAAALAGLPEKQRVTVMLVHCFEWTLSEVATHLVVSKGTVQTHLARGMARLRSELGAES